MPKRKHKKEKKDHNKTTQTMHETHGYSTDTMRRCFGLAYTWQPTEKEGTIRKWQRKIQHKPLKCSHSINGIKECEGRKECAGNRSKAQSKERSVCEGKVAHREYDMKDYTDATY